MNKYKTLSQIENRLEELYELGQQGSAEYLELEAKADKLAYAETERQERARLALIREQKRVEEIKAQLAAGDLSVIDAFGIPEFGSDYQIREEGTNYVVYSAAARPDQQDRHLCSSREEAVSKLRKLVWDRLYSKYVRTGEVDELDQLKN